MGLPRLAESVERQRGSERVCARGGAATISEPNCERSQEVRVTLGAHRRRVKAHLARSLRGGASRGVAIPSRIAVIAHSGVDRSTEATKESCLLYTSPSPRD